MSKKEENMQVINFSLTPYECDLGTLDAGILVFQAAYGCDPYVICSDKTKNMIATYATRNMEIYERNIYKYERNIDKYDENSRINSYRGYKIFTDNTLPFGKIQIR